MFLGSDCSQLIEEGWHWGADGEGVGNSGVGGQQRGGGWGQQWGGVVFNLSEPRFTP